MNPPSHKSKRIIKIGAVSYAKMVKLMLEGVYNCQEIADETGLHYVTVLQYARELYLAGAAHICNWEHDSRGRDIVKIYKIGQGKDAKRKTLTPAQRQRRYKAKKYNLQLIQRMAA